MPRVTEAEVRAIAGEPASVSAAAAVTTAEFWVTKLLETPGLITDADHLKQIELYLAAHFLYLTERGGPVAAETLGDASERYHNIFEAGLGSTTFGQQAMLFDTTGTLAAWNKTANTKSNKLKAKFTVIGPSISDPLIP